MESLNAVLKSIKEDIKGGFEYVKAFLYLSLIASIVGLVVGFIGFVFHHLLEEVTAFRVENPVIVYFLPVAGLAIVLLYKIFKRENCKGTNLVLMSVRSEEEIPIIMAPLIFISTALTHLFGGSAGREGAALQLGGSIAQQIGRWFRIDAKALKIVTMCGMSACFSALFGTPLAAAVFSMEVISVGVMYYSALLPCTISALIGASISQYFGAVPTSFVVTGVPASITFTEVMRVVLLGALAALVSIIFCRILRSASKIYKKLLKNQYLCAFIGGSIVVLLSLILNTRDYLGAGMDIITRAIELGSVKPEAFLLKILFTAVTLGAGFKGGEIVPSFFVGSTFGCLIGSLIGMDPSFAAALGLLAVFCGVTNCPLATLIIGFELFGFEGAMYYLLIVAVSYMLSGYYGLYSQQKIMYSKFKPEFININCK